MSEREQWTPLPPGSHLQNLKGDEWQRGVDIVALRMAEPWYDDRVEVVTERGDIVKPDRTSVIKLGNKPRSDRTVCDHCGAHEHVELHHWAPRAYFDDADDWGTVPLCRTCHTSWHNVIGRQPWREAVA